MSLSLVVITNKKKLDELFLSRLDFADELMVVPNQGDFASFAQKRNQALQKVKGDWVLFVDDDEVVSRELAQEATKAIKNSRYQGYFLKRQDVVFNQVLKYGEVGKIKILRLAQKTSGQFQRAVHETWEVKGPIGLLKNPLYHLKNSFVSEFISRINFYGPLDAKALSAENKPFSFFKLLVFPKAKFLLNYFLRKGFLDGYPGLFLAYLMSLQSLSVRIFQWENQRS